MNRMNNNLGAIQNMGLEDRGARAVLGTALLAISVIHLHLGATVSWHGYAMLVAIYPLLTAILGWDPFYALIGGKSCDTSERNRCGTFPMELKAAFNFARPQPIRRRRRH